MTGLIESFQRDIDRVFDEFRALWSGRDKASASGDFFDRIEDIRLMIRKAYANSRLQVDEKMRQLETAFDTLATYKPRKGYNVDWGRVEPPLLAVLTQISEMRTTANSSMLPLPWRVYDFFMGHPIGVIIVFLAMLIVPNLICS